MMALGLWLTAVATSAVALFLSWRCPPQLAWMAWMARQCAALGYVLVKLARA